MKKIMLCMYTFLHISKYTCMIHEKSNLKKSHSNKYIKSNYRINVKFRKCKKMRLNQTKQHFAFFILRQTSAMYNENESIISLIDKYRYLSTVVKNKYCRKSVRFWLQNLSLTSFLRAFVNFHFSSFFLTEWIFTYSWGSNRWKRRSKYVRALSFYKRFSSF
jgi:hypothetical protein